jgi:hypothetical protein
MSETAYATWVCAKCHKPIFGNFVTYGSGPDLPVYHTECAPSGMSFSFVPLHENIDYDRIRQIVREEIVRKPKA